MSEHKEGTPSPEDEAPLVNKPVEVGDKFKVADQVYTFVGVVEDEASEDNGKPLGQLEGEELHKPFTGDQLERGIFAQETEDLIKDIDEEMPKLMADYWEAECTGEAGKTNNPEGLTL